MDKNPKRFEIAYSLIVADKEYPRTITLDASSKYDAKQKLIRKVNKETIDRFEITSIELK